MSRAPGGGIFTVKIPTFSGKTAENVMGVYGIDCPAIFWDRECTTFWGGGRGCAGALTRPSTRHLPLKNFEKTALRKRGGIFTIKIPFFSGETAEKGMGVYGFDCPAIFWDQECSTFWGVLEGVLEH